MLDNSQLMALQLMGVDVYQDKRTDTEVTPPQQAYVVEKINIRILQCQTKNHISFLCLADWPSQVTAELETLFDKVMQALGQVQQELAALPENLSQPILTLGKAAKQMSLHYQPAAKVFSTYSLQQLLLDPSRKRQAWLLMQQLTCISN